MFTELAAPGVRRLQPYIPGKPIAELQREYGVSGIIKLASNENPLGPAPCALEAARAALPELARYPDGAGFELKQALSRKHGVTPEQITLGNGSNDILELLTRAFVTPEHEVIFSEHSFAVYPIVTQAVGATARVAPARDFGHDLDAMRGLIGDRTRVIFIANPNNPTGTWLDRESLEAFVRAVPRHALVVIDEAYYEYAIDSETRYPDTLPWVARYANLVTTRTFSKAYGLAGLRVGYGVSHPEVADLLNRVRQPFNVNSLAQAAALAALEDREHLARSVALNRAGMAQLTQAFTRLRLSFIPSLANFISVDVERPAQPVYEGLLREGVIVRPVANYGMPRHLRVTIGTHEENARFLGALEKVLEE
ncbi:MAG: histidinol-phosphate transaminase [Gammaproteobacteria bacterium]|nr:MAG: histidinol-phosphate transaminase [Gammaproteobacteria bacterium]